LGHNNKRETNKVTRSLYNHLQ